MRYQGLFRRLFNGDSADNGFETENTPAEQNAEDGCELAAVIAAAVYEYMNANPGSGLKVVSIRRTGQTVPVWSRAGRMDRISGKL